VRDEVCKPIRRRQSAVGDSRQALNPTAPRAVVLRSRRWLRIAFGASRRWCCPRPRHR
jgi:hypothetical protein